LAGREKLARDYVRAHARKVADVMITNVITAMPDTSLRDIASLLERNRIKRVPIVEGGKLVGIVSRANLLQAFASLYLAPSSAAGTSDAEIRKQVYGRLRAETWGSPSMLNIVVQEGVVELWGAVNSEAEHKAIRIAAETTPGVASVKDNLMIGMIPSGY
jgi:CBS-domain-containing membrane protein